MTPTLTAEQIGELEALLAKATPAPWDRDTENGRREETFEMLIDSNGKVIADTANSDLQVIDYDSDEDGTRYFDETGYRNFSAIAALHNAAPALIAMAKRVANPSFQDRVKPWMMTCFGAEISADKVERGDRVLEEVFELMQAVGYDPTRVLAIRDYVWGRPIGDPPQETGGVMVTLAAFCLAHGLDMHRAGETELARINQPDIVLKIRAKQAAKPTGSALPIAMPPAEAPRTCDTCAYQEMICWIERHHPCAGCTPISLWPNWTPKPIPSTTDKGGAA